MNFLAVDAFIEQTIAEGLIPGAVIGVANKEGILYQKAYGQSFPAQQINMTTDTLFDVASLTKVVATTPAILYCLERGLLDLDDTVGYYFPQFQNNYPEVTLKHLLTHTSGWRAFYPFHIEQTIHTDILDTIANLPAEAPLGSAVIYSDLNFIVLGKVVEHVTKKPLDLFCTQELYQPLRMHTTRFTPNGNPPLPVAPTELQADGTYTWGVVHDENARYFGGVSGHAGLFSSVKDVLRFGQLWLRGGESFFRPATVHMATTCYTPFLNEARAIGFETYSEGKYSGQYLKDGFGHTGFTGTSLWVSPKENVVVVILTNRVHFRRHHNIARFRRIVHNLTALALR